MVTTSSTVPRTQPRSSLLNNSTAELNSSSHAAPAHSPSHSIEENDPTTTIPVHPKNTKETSSLLGRLSPTIPTSSPLYQILTNHEYTTIYDIRASKMNTNHKFLVARGLDDCCRSVPHSITTYYINLLVATVHEKLGIDIPYEVRYTADGPDQPYTTQAQAYGLDKLMSDPNASQPGELPLLLLPDFSSNLYLTIRNTKTNGRRDGQPLPHNPPANQNQEQQVPDPDRGQTRTTAASIR